MKYYFEAKCGLLRRHSTAVSNEWRALWTEYFEVLLKSAHFFCFLPLCWLDPFHRNPYFSAKTGQNWMKSGGWLAKSMYYSHSHFEFHTVSPYWQKVAVLREWTKLKTGRKYIGSFIFAVYSNMYMSLYSWLKCRFTESNCNGSLCNCFSSPFLLCSMQHTVFWASKFCLREHICFDKTYLFWQNIYAECSRTI